MLWYVTLSLVAMLLYVLRFSTLGPNVLVVGAAVFVFSLLFGTLVRLFK